MTTEQVNEQIGETRALLIKVDICFHLHQCPRSGKSFIEASLSDNLHKY